MATFYVSFPCTWSTCIEADTPQQAADFAEAEAPSEINIDGFAFVVNTETKEEFEDI